MAVKNIRVDDVDKATMASDTIPFAYRGKRYEIDLSEDNAKQFDDDLSKWIDHARVISGGGGGKKQATPTKRSSNGNSSSNGDTTDKAQYYATVREWARASGRKVYDRGRLPGDLLDAYEQAQK